MPTILNNRQIFWTYFFTKFKLLLNKVKMYQTSGTNQMNKEWRKLKKDQKTQNMVEKAKFQNYLHNQ
jgi:hypothetical protein